MKFRYFLILGAFLLSIAWPLVGYSQSAPEQSDSSTAVAKPLTNGEVKRLDLDAGKVTIKHGEIKNLEMPPMTMVFVAKDRSQLANLKVGDKVNFVVLNEAGKFIASDIQAAQQ
jgi:Cu/Ag efflux protein CusF